jgi:hypothetical protein
MTETKWAPGPWRVAQIHVETGMAMNGGEWAVMHGDINDDDGGRVCVVDAQTPFKRGKGHQHDCDIRNANANLIAAAPELYALLAELIDIVGPQPGTALWAKKVQEVLRKARGKS